MAPMLPDGLPAFDALFDAHYVRLRAYALRRVDDESIVDDVVSETFATAWRRREEMPRSPLPWLFAICSRVISNQRRAGRRLSRLRARLRSQPAEGSRDAAELIEESAVIRQALGRLKDDQRELLILVAWDGLDTAAAAAVVGCTPATCRVRLHRARTQLSRELARATEPRNVGPGFSADDQIEILQEVR